MNENEVTQGLIFECIAGSHSYGTNTPESDLDIRGICIPKDRSYYTGIGLKLNRRYLKMWKLVRDKIPGMIDSKFVMYGVETKKLLAAKLYEEVLELHEAKTKEEMTEELADIMQVMEAFCQHMEISAEDIQTKKTEKLTKRGGFTDLVMIYIDND